MKLLTYYHTIKYLKFRQIYHRILKKFTYPKANLIEGNSAVVTGEWTIQELYKQKFFDEENVNFLNHNGCIKNVDDWNNAEQQKLWIYNLHYFDDLNSVGSKQRKLVQLNWISKWIQENPVDDGGNGWEAYTLSLRIVNWIKAFLSGLTYEQNILDSLAQQADFLSQDLEKHLLGNHYFVNLKALLFAGCFLDGKHADAWLEIALHDFESELKEQVLSDGGSFELTPMYHAIMITDLLDLYNLFQAFPLRVPEGTVALIHKTIVEMLVWLDKMSHGDDEISFFNDAAFDIAPKNLTIRDYARQLGFEVDKMVIPHGKLIIHDLDKTGYVSVKSREVSLIADLSAVGPSYIPGHAHADSLSFELSLAKSRVFVNSGTSEYGVSKERLRQRETSAHNTVVVNGKNSSEVWSGFRVARRAGINNRNIGQVSSEQIVQFSASHNGYKKQGVNCIHERTWKVSLNDCEIHDCLKGEFESAICCLHLHPDIKIISVTEDGCILQSKYFKIELNVTDAILTLENSSWHPKFGVVMPSKKLRFEYLQSRVSYKINWTKR